MDYDARENGADNKGNDICTDIVNGLIDEAAKEGGGIISFTAGVYRTGSIHMKSNITLNICSGAVLFFVTDTSEYPIIDSRWEGAERETYAACIHAEYAENITITGRGSLECNGEFWWRKFREGSLDYPRPNAICFDNCENAVIENITILNSPGWTVHPMCCTNVSIRGITIKNPDDSPNTDGINPESCRYVRISDCHIDVGDDCVTLKSGTEDSDRIVCENIIIENCTMARGHGGVVIGSEMSGGVRNVLISNCVFDGTDRGIRIKSRRGRGGAVEDIRVSNLYMRDVICPFVMNLYYFCGPRGKDKYVWDKEPYPVTEETPAIRRIYIDNVTARNVRASAGFMYGLAERYIEDIRFTNISISMAENPIPEVPAMMSGLEPMSGKGFFMGNCRNISFVNVEAEGIIGLKYIMENCENIVI